MHGDPNGGLTRKRRPASPLVLAACVAGMLIAGLGNTAGALPPGAVHGTARTMARRSREPPATSHPPAASHAPASPHASASPRVPTTPPAAFASHPPAAPRVAPAAGGPAGYDAKRAAILGGPAVRRKPW